MRWLDLKGSVKIVLQLYLSGNGIIEISERFVLNVELLEHWNRCCIILRGSTDGGEVESNYFV